MSTLRVYIGWDGRDALAYEVCKASLLKHASIPVEVLPLKDWELRHSGAYWRSFRTESTGQRWDDRDGKPFSTDFSFTRFCVPMLEDFGCETVLFTDPDMLWRADVAELLGLFDASYAVMCVQHEHTPPEEEKLAGLKQTLYHRKNWSSLMMLQPALCGGLTKYAVNNRPGQWLHAMCWSDELEIGSLPEEWNWLEGWSSPDIDPKIVHFTRGTPDLPGYDDVRYADEWWRYAVKPTALPLAVGA